MSDTRPIGVFDSGVGGLTVARAILDLLPHEPILYVGDNARFPYGPKPADEIRRYALEVADYLVNRDVKMIVVACNSVEVSAIGDIALRAGIPVVGVIDPGVRAAAHATRNGVVGMIGTVATVTSGAYDRAIARGRLRSHAPFPGLSGVRRARRARGYDERRAKERRARVSFPASGYRDRHLDTWLHALPAVVGSASARAGTTRWCWCPRPRRPPKTYTRRFSARSSR